MSTNHHGISSYTDEMTDIHHTQITGPHGTYLVTEASEDLFYVRRLGARKPAAHRRTEAEAIDLATTLAGLTLIPCDECGSEPGEDCQPWCIAAHP